MFENKNFIRNHSGHCKFKTSMQYMFIFVAFKKLNETSLAIVEFEGWDVSKENVSGWAVEEVAIGCDPLPKDPFFDSSKSCFVTSNYWASKSFTLDLRDIGLTFEMMVILSPFEIRCTQM